MNPSFRQGWVGDHGIWASLQRLRRQAAASERAAFIWRQEFTGEDVLEIDPFGFCRGHAGRRTGRRASAVGGLPAGSLRMDTIGNPTGRADATFRVTN